MTTWRWVEVAGRKTGAPTAAQQQERDLLWRHTMPAEGHVIVDQLSRPGVQEEHGGIQIARCHKVVQYLEAGHASSPRVDLTRIDTNISNCSMEDRTGRSTGHSDTSEERLLLYRNEKRRTLSWLILWWTTTKGTAITHEMMCARKSHRGTPAATARSAGIRLQRCEAGSCRVGACLCGVLGTVRSCVPTSPLPAKKKKHSGKETNKDSTPDSAANLVHVSALSSRNMSEHVLGTVLGVIDNRIVDLKHIATLFAVTNANTHKCACLCEIMWARVRACVCVQVKQ